MTLSPWTNATELAKTLRKRELSPAEVASFYLQRAARHQEQINAFCWLDAERVREAVEHLPKDPTGLFWGVPIPVKDLSDALGDPATLGSQAAAERIGKADSAVISSLRRSKALLFGRTNSPELGTLPVTGNQLHGPTRNPWSLDHTAGGSSGGAAAAVAAGLAPIAHASDGGGSIRIPASCCHLVGLKASRGRIPKGPTASDVLHGFSVDGCVSRTVRDTARFLDAVAYDDPTAWYSLPAPSLNYERQLDLEVVPVRFTLDRKGPLDREAHPAYYEAMEKVARALSSLGHRNVNQPMNWDGFSPEHIAQSFFKIWYTGTAYSDIADFTQLSPLNQKLRENGLATDSLTYIRSYLHLQIFARSVLHRFNGMCDIMIQPTLAMLPPKVEWLTDQETGSGDEILWKATEMVPYTGWTNITGQPSISIPIGFHDGLPIGVQLIGPPRGEGLLLQIAQQLEDVFHWDKEFPRAFLD